MLRFPKASGEIPAITKAQMVEVDRLMVEEYGISLEQMMENAGRSLAVVARDAFFKGNVRDKGVVVLAGTGGNGGGALACARRLHIWGAKVRVVLAKPAAEYTGVPAQQLAALQRMAVISLPEPPSGAQLVIDGLIGYSLKGAPRGKTRDLIEWTNRQIMPVLSLDVPSGLDATTGHYFAPTVRASATMTLALPKTGLLTKNARPKVGELYLADISVPRTLYSAPGIGVNVGSIFSEGDILKLR
ncbi:MAG: NAD(P)H-hydrate epimerase [Bacteroidota bacterium]